MVVWSRGVRYTLTAGVSIETSLWNRRTQRVRVNNNAPLVSSVENEMLDKVNAAAIRTISKFKLQREPPSASEFREAFDTELRGKPVTSAPKIPLFTKYMEGYIERYRATKSYNTTRAIVTVFNKLREFEQHRRKRLTFESVDMSLYAELSTWFARQGYREGYFSAAIKVIKQVFREAREVDKVHSFDGINAKGFSSSSSEVDNIYLNEAELHAIHGLPLSLELLRVKHPSSRDSDLLRKLNALQTARSFFLIGAYTGLRVSDFTRLSQSNISDRIRIRTRKTGKEVVIPIHPIVREIIDSGIDLSAPPSSQRLNDSLKELARLAGIDGIVEVSRRIGAETVTERLERWQLVSSHTARRSFATNAYKAGVPTIAIMKITGHTKEANFLKYIKVSNEENAEVLEMHPFFSPKTP